MLLSVDHLHFCHAWILQSIGNYSTNIFLLTRDCLQLAAERLFFRLYKDEAIAYPESYMRAMWKYVHPASFNITQDQQEEIEARRSKAKRQH
jgi:hypothetical protein